MLWGVSRGTEGRPQTPESPTSHPGLGPAGPRTPAGSAGLARARRPLGAGGNRRPTRGFLKQSPETRPSSEFICSPVFYKAFDFPARPSGHSSVSLTSRHLRFGSREAGSHGDISPSALRPANPGPPFLFTSFPLHPPLPFLLTKNKCKTPGFLRFLFSLVFHLSLWHFRGRVIFPKAAAIGDTPALLLPPSPLHAARRGIILEVTSAAPPTTVSTQPLFLDRVCKFITQIGKTSRPSTGPPT